MESNKYQFIPTFSLVPNKITTFNTVFRFNDYYQEYRNVTKKKKYIFENKDGVNVKIELKRKSHNLKISDNAYRTMQKKINWLYYLSIPSKQITYNKKLIYNFKINFITLTLPSKQQSCTRDINERFLNQFLTEIRTRFQVTNYVWRLEYQKNGNVHYHIVTDVYIDYFALQSIWNRIIEKDGYVTEYSNKMKSLSLSEYHNIYGIKNKLSFSESSKRYAKGCAEKWSRPPTVDTKSVVSGQAVAGYLSKYFSKSDDNNTIMNEFDNDDNTKNMRLWYCSRSLSKLNTISEYIEAYDYDIFKIVSKAKDLKKFVCKYATIFYFNISNMTGNGRKWIDFILNDYATKMGYWPHKLAFKT